jgi:hypothetical protein
VTAYTLTYTVQAPNHLMAVMNAGALLRTGVAVTSIVDVDEFAPGWWHVSLAVEEGEPERPLFLHEDPAYADPITAAKWAADR